MPTTTKKKKFVPNKKRVDNYQIVTDEIVKALESGSDLPWVKPWRSTGALRNAFTNRPYKGINTLLLGMQGYSDPRWATYNQIAKHEGNVKKGEKGTKVILWKFLNKEDEDGNKKTFPLLKTFTIFNIQQTENLKIPTVEEMLEKNKGNATSREDLDSIVEDTGAVINHGGDRAYYSPMDDEVTMPMMDDFEDTDGYYSVLFHELGHWTGHASRLGRDGIIKGDGFGGPTYAFEELVAELTSAFLGRDLGFDGSFRDNHSAYIQSWIKVLKEDKHAIFRASSQAEKAAKFILGDNAKEETTEEEN